MRHSARRSHPLQALVVMLALVPAAASAQSGAPAAAPAAKPDFSGTYAFLQKRSDNLQEAIAKAVGPDYTQGSKKSEQARVWIHTWLEGVVITCTDHGIGIPDGDIPLVFNRFYRARNATVVGSGLGLTIVRSIVRRHGGTVTLRSTVDVGTELEIRMKVEPHA